MNMSVVMSIVSFVLCRTWRSDKDKGKEVDTIERGGATINCVAPMREYTLAPGAGAALEPATAPPTDPVHIE